MSVDLPKANIMRLMCVHNAGSAECVTWTLQKPVTASTLSISHREDESL